ncbi:MAG: SDR family NAD(P)-dependent oxidoreductase [Bacilli bacterium]|nr:SDR family NAD(P)-dependent oxidoreductase [Bacilli bacterium]
MNILITGAAGGIAREVICQLKTYPVHLYMSVHTEMQLELAKERYKNDSNITCLKIDITNKKDQKKVENLDIDVLISNAAIGSGCSMAEIEIEKVRENFEVNVFSNYKIIQMVLKNMIKKGKGRIIMMASLAGHYPIPFLGSYCATKASIIKMAECLRKELLLLEADIDVVLIEPGLYRTGFNEVMFENKYGIDKKSYFKEEIALIRMKESILSTVLSKKEYRTIVKQIMKAVCDPYPKKVYRAPFLQSTTIALYRILSALLV